MNNKKKKKKIVMSQSASARSSAPGGSRQVKSRMAQGPRGFHEYCQRVLFRHPSIRRIAKQLKTARKHSRKKVSDSKNG